MKKFSSFLVVTLAIASASCVHVPIAEGIDENDSIKIFNFKCDEPYELTRDCSSHTFALHEITIDDTRMNVAGSTSGDVIFVQGPDPFADCMTKDFFLLNCPSHSKASNAGYEALRAFLAGEKVKVRRVRPLLSAGNIVGYYLELPIGAYDVVLNATKGD